jgi:hypothetical protein
MHLVGCEQTSLVFVFTPDECSRFSAWILPPPRVCPFFWRRKGRKTHKSGTTGDAQWRAKTDPFFVRGKKAKQNAVFIKQKTGTEQGKRGCRDM